MKTILLSFKPHIYDKIYDGEKIFEHRRRFPDEPVMAYMYVSKPKKEIAGIVYLDRRIEIATWLNDYSYDADAVSRIKKYLMNYNYVMPILKFQSTTGISLHTMQQKFPTFVAPQSYIYLDDKPEILQFIQSNIEIKTHKIENSFDNITSDQICIN